MKSESLKRSIALVGMPGSGKSTVGQALSKRMHLALQDTDKLIAARVGLSIPEYFSKFGENSFRSEESLALFEALSKGASVVATGGGVVLSEANRKLLAERSHVVYLRATPRSLEKRLAHTQHRPLLHGVDLAERINSLYSARANLYLGVADVVIDVDGIRVAEVVRKIEDSLTLQ